MQRTIVLGLLALASLPGRVDAQGRLSARTGNSIELGIEACQYSYVEDVGGNFFMSNTGRKLGLTGTMTERLSDNWYVSADARGAVGTVYYDSAGAGNKGSNPDDIWELRFVGGKDFGSDSQVVSPYAGLGYRILNNNSRGFTSTGAAGYRRRSEYTYLPIGITHRVRLDRTARIATRLEYDYLFEGTQTSRLSDMGTGLDDATNTQRYGRGLRLNLAYETISWSIGIFYHHWDIQKSDVNAMTSGGVHVGTILEPHNITHEIGAQFKYRFE
jgi:hypothetical protein